MGWEEFKAFVYTLLYLDAAAIHWYNLGKSEWETFLILCGICMTGLTLTFKLFDFGFSTLKKISEKHRWQYPKCFQSFYQRFVKNPRARLIKKFVEILAKQRYFLFFVCNAIPTVPFLTTTTIAAARLTKSKYAFWAIFSGNILKVYIIVTVTYRIGDLFK